MTTPAFVFDEDLNGYVSDPFTVEEEALARIELESLAPVVVLKMEEDGGYANYGQTVEESDRYEIKITSKDEATLRLATPVGVKKCYIIN